jgi:hypothetical protein
VINTGDFDGVRRDLADGYVRQGREYEFATAGQAAAGSPKIGKVFQSGASLIDGSGNSTGRFRIIALDPLANALQIFRRGQRPTEFHQGCRNR